MTIAVLVLLGCIVGFAIGRWWALGIGPVIGFAALVASATTGASMRDTPAVFVALVTMVAISLGVTLRHHLDPQLT